MIKIKWIRLKKIGGEEVGRNVDLYMSTQQTPFKAAVQFNGQSVKLFINARNCKTEDDAINAIAHELAHVKLNNSEDNEAHGHTWNEMYKRIRDKYYEEELG